MNKLKQLKNNYNIIYKLNFNVLNTLHNILLLYYSILFFSIDILYFYNQCYQFITDIIEIQTQNIFCDTNVKYGSRIKMYLHSTW